MRLLKISLGFLGVTLFLYSMTPFLQDRAWSYCIYVPQIPISHGDYYSGLRSDCFYGQVSSRKEPSLCLYLSNDERKREDGIYNDCIGDFARGTGDNSMCHLLTNNYSIRDHCYKDAAETMSNLMMCKLVEAQTIQDACYYQIAKKQQNVSACEYVVDDYEQDDCRNVASGGKPTPEPTAEIEIVDGIITCTDLQGFSKGTIQWNYARENELSRNGAVLGVDGSKINPTFVPPYDEWAHVYLYWKTGARGHKISNTINNPGLMQD